MVSLRIDQRRGLLLNGFSCPNDSPIALNRSPSVPVRGSKLFTWKLKADGGGEAMKFDPGGGPL